MDRGGHRAASRSHLHAVMGRVRLDHGPKRVRRNGEGWVRGVPTPSVAEKSGAGARTARSWGDAQERKRELMRWSANLAALAEAVREARADLNAKEDILAGHVLLRGRGDRLTVIGRDTFTTIS